MGIVQGSVTITTGSTGNYTVQMPENDLDVIGFAPLGLAPSGPTYEGPVIVGVYIDASNIAYFPLPPTGSYTLRKYSPVHVKVKGNVLNLYVQSLVGGGLTIFYGIPDGSEIEYTTLKGVVGSFTNTSTTANASGTLNVTFPSGNVRIIGIFVLGVNQGVGQIQFITGTGRTLYIPFADTPDPMDLPHNLIPLDLSSATQLSINYNINYNSSGNAAFYLIIYYQ